MPTYMKVIITILVTIAAVTTHFFQAAAGQETTKWVVLVLGAMMIFALWIFPEAKKNKSD